MIPSEQAIETLHRKYAPNNTVFQLVYTHCQIVAEIALWCAGNVKGQPVDRELLLAAALLHDISKYSFVNEDGKAVNRAYQQQHGILGAALVSDEGIASKIADIIATHVGVGISKQDILEHPEWHLPARDYMPASIEAELVCYADCFHSKRPIFHHFETYKDIIASWQNAPSNTGQFEAWSERFGIPDIDALAKKYGHPVH